MHPIQSTVKRILRILSLVLLCMTTTCAMAWGTGNFKVEAIQIIGLHRLPQNAVLNQLPIQVGDWFDESKSEYLIKQLYATQWFKEVKLIRRGTRLEVVVVERPIISQVVFKGSQGIPQDNLDKMLQEAGLVGGEFFNPFTLEAIKKSLMHGYAMGGKHAVKIEASVIPETEGTVKILVNVHPGPTLRFASIRLLGSRALSEKRILTELPITSHRVWALIEGKLTHCTKDTREQALAVLRRFYENQGYCDVKINANRLSITADRRAADWIIELTEGPRYKIGGYRILGESYGLTKKKLAELIRFKVGDVFSRRAVLSTENAIKQHFGEDGYIFAQVRITPHVDDKTRRIYLAIQIERGEKTYVRRIDILGNRYIQERILRGLVLQPEASLASTKDFEDSEQNLLQSGLMEQTDLVPVPVAGTKDQVDLVVDVHEIPRKVSMNPIGLDWGVEGVAWHAYVGVENPLGTGEDIHINMAKVAREVSTEFRYKNNFAELFGLQGVKYHVRAHFVNRKVTWDLKTLGDLFNRSSYIRAMRDQSHYLGDLVSSGYRSVKSGIGSIFGRSTRVTAMPEKDTGKDDKTEDNKPKEVKKSYVERSQFDFDSWGLRFDLDLPGGRFGNFWQMSAEVRSRYLYLPEKEKEQATQIQNFLKEYGEQVCQLILRGGRYTRQLKGRNFFFPTGGGESNLLLSVALSGMGKWNNKGDFREQLAKLWDTVQSLHYFKLDYFGSQFWNLAPEDSLRDHVFGIRWHFGIGQRLTWSGGSLPFFDAYYSGRFYGYKYDSLGPKDSIGNMLGGDLLLKAQCIYFLPKPLSGDFLQVANIAWPYRSSLFLQVGNVYELKSLSSLREKQYTDFPLSLSVGAAFELLLKIPMLGVFPGYVSLSYPILFNGKTGARKEHTQHFGIGIGFTIG